MGKKRRNLQPGRVEQRDAALRQQQDLLVQVRKRMRAGQNSEAVELLKALVRQSPDIVSHHILLGDIALGIRDFQTAIDAYGRALQLDSRNSDVYVGLGLAMHEFRHFEGAVAAFEISSLFKPGQHLPLAYRAMSLIELQRFPEALSLLDEAIAIAPEDPTHYLRRGRLRSRMGDESGCLGDFGKAVSLRPDDAVIRMGHAVHWYQSRNHEAALEAVESLIRAGKADALAMNFKGVVLGEMGRHKESKAAYQAVVDKYPDHHDSRFNLALACLMDGDFDRGWELYESRWKRSEAPPSRTFTAPLWLGEEPLEGKTILIHAEQGLGDMIQFSRYVPFVAERACRVLFEVPSALQGLFDNLPANVQTVSGGTEIPPYDLRCPLLSLPLALKSRVPDIPATGFELSCDAGQHRVDLDRLFKPADLRVGVVWSGNPGHTNDHNRSLSFDRFRACIEDLPQVLCLQKDYRDTDRAEMADYGRAADVSSQLHCMSDTAALIRQLDLVITVDTSVAHLAATLGKPVWILIPFRPDFRWQLERTDSPWYPTVRLFRQQAVADWSAPLRQIRKELAMLRSTQAGSLAHSPASLPSGLADRPTPIVLPV